MRVNTDIRRYLRGRVTVGEDGYMRPIENTVDAIKVWQGAPNGAVGSVLLGISHRAHTYEISSDIDEAFEVFASYMQTLGRLAVVNQANTFGCYCRGGMRDVIFYTVEKEAVAPQTITVTAFTARSLTSFFKLKSAMKRFDQRATIGLDVNRVETTEDTAVPENATSREAKSAAKAQAKAQAKADKAAEKAALAEKMKAQNSGRHKINR